MVKPMGKTINILDRLPPRPTPLEAGRIVEPVAPFLHSHVDSFEAWASRQIYEEGKPPLSPDELRQLRKNWRR
jgi:hypothetical protein